MNNQTATLAPPARSAQHADGNVDATASTLLDRLGGPRGLVDGALPPVVFAAANAATGLLTGPETTVPSLWWALAAAFGAAAVLIGLRVAQGQSMKAALSGLAGLAIAAGVAAWTGQARNFFLPGIYVDAAYAVAFTGSALVGRPLVGYLYVVLFQRHSDWRTSPRLRRLFTLATLGWAGVYALRFTATGYLYRVDAPELLAVAKVALGWPLTALAVVATLAALRRASRLSRVGGGSGPGSVSAAS